jgi:AcrR family transcriptional regulator
VFILDTIPSGRYNVIMKKSLQYSKTREAILDAANRTLKAKGAEGFTLEAVAQETPVSKGGLLYHFPSKNSLIEGMIARSIAQVDAALEEELEKSGGDYLAAYIRASFRTTVDPEQVSRAIFSAIAGDASLLEPLRAHFEKMQSEITAAAPTQEAGTLIRLCLDGLWYAQVYNFAPPDPELRQRLQDTLLELVRYNYFSKDKNA